MMEFLLLPVILCFLRISSFVAFLPPFGGQHVPNTVKVGLVMALTVFWLPRAMPTLSPFNVVSSQQTNVTDASGIQSLSQTRVAKEGTARWLLWTWLAAREILLGAGLGWLLGMILIPMRIAGSWLAEQIGLNIASIAAGTDTGSGNVLAVILESFGVLMLYSMSVHHDFLRIFDRFFDQYQVGKPWNFPDIGWIIGTLTKLPERGLAIAAPLGVVFFLIMVVLMFAMKQSPQFNLFTFGMPFRLAAGLIAMVVMFPSVLSRVSVHLQEFLVTPL
jgi:flagellar biosynthetic protein FliR